VAHQPEIYTRRSIEGMLERMPPLKQLRKADSLDQKVFEKALTAERVKQAGKWWQFWKRFRRRGRISRT
jgi:hypothetical protein